MKDLEGYLATPFVRLATWAGVPYNGEWRNACAAHIMAGWALTLTLMCIYPYTAVLSIVYPFIRELQDASWEIRYLNKKSAVDLLTFMVGNMIGGLVWSLLSLTNRM